MPSRRMDLFPTFEEIAERAYQLLVEAKTVDAVFEYWGRAEDELLQRAVRRWSERWSSCRRGDAIAPIKGLAGRAVSKRDARAARFVMIIRTWSLDRTTIVLDVHGALVAETGAALAEAVSGAILSGKGAVVLNLARVTNIDAAGLGQVAASIRQIRAAGGKPKVVVRGHTVRELLARTRLMDVVQIIDADGDADAAENFA
jgi:anti-anti-sigma factor